MPPAFLDAILHRARIPSCPPKAFLKSLPLLPRAACPNRPSLAPLSVLSSTACASSATTCSASLLTDLMPSNAPSVTRDDPRLSPFRFLPYLRACRRHRHRLWPRRHRPARKGPRQRRLPSHCHRPLPPPHCPGTGRILRPAQRLRRGHAEAACRRRL